MFFPNPGKVKFTKKTTLTFSIPSSKNQGSNHNSTGLIRLNCTSIRYLSQHCVKHQIYKSKLQFCRKGTIVQDVGSIPTRGNERLNIYFFSLWSVESKRGVKFHSTQNAHRNRRKVESWTLDILQTNSKANLLKPRKSIGICGRHDTAVCQIFSSTNSSFQIYALIIKHWFTPYDVRYVRVYGLYFVHTFDL